MKLYHGTTKTALESIAAKGIWPRYTAHGNWQGAVASNPLFVYLTNIYAPFFARVAGSVAENLSNCAIVEVDTDKLNPMNLCPDEDALEQVNRGRDGLPKKWSMKRRTKYYRERMSLYAGQWEASINVLGTCAHEGVIPTDAITRAITLDFRANPHLINACDPSGTSLMINKILAPRYRMFTAHLFGDPLDIDGTDSPSLWGPADIAKIPLTGIEHYPLPSAKEPATAAA